MENNCRQILELVWGEEQCCEIITKTVEEYVKGNPILNTFAILM